MMSLRALRAASLIGARDFSSIWSWKTWLLGWFVRTTTTALAWSYLGRLLQSDSLTAQLLIGQLFVITANTAAWAIPAAAWDRMDGTYALLIISPTSYFWALFGRTSVWCLNSLASGFFAFIAAAVVLGVPVFQLPAAGLFASIAATCIAAYAFSLFWGVWVSRWPRVRNIFLGIASIAMATLTGAIVPFSYLPAGLQKVSIVLPVTHALQGFQQSAGSAGRCLPGVGAELLVAAGWGCAALVMIWLGMQETRHGVRDQ